VAGQTKASIDGNHFNGRMVEQQPEKASSDSSETVDGYFSFHIGGISL
jgi:hypothetical protein